MPFTLLQVGESQLREFVATKSARQQNGQQRPITFSLQSIRIGCLPKRLPLFRGQPVAQSDTQLLDALNAPDARRQVGAEETAI